MLPHQEPPIRSHESGLGILRRTWGKMMKEEDKEKLEVQHNFLGQSDQQLNSEVTSVIYTERFHFVPEAN